MVLFSRSVAFILQFNFLLATWTILSLWHDILVREWLHTMPYEVFLPTDLLHSSTVLQSLQVCVCIHPSFALLYLCTCKLNFSIWYPSLVEAAARSGDQGNHLMMYEPRKTLSTCAIVCVCAWVYFWTFLLCSCALRFLSPQIGPLLQVGHDVLVNGQRVSAQTCS